MANAWLKRDPQQEPRFDDFCELTASFKRNVKRLDLLIDYRPCCDSPEDLHLGRGFSLLEMMSVVALIMIVASISAPIYHRAVVLSRETVLRDHLFTLRSLIDRFTLDNQRPPASLGELVEQGYLGRIPTDPFTGSSETWQVVIADIPSSVDDALERL
jgi:general secretion pathway protein G